MAASINLTPEQRTLRARQAALARWSREDPKPHIQRLQRGLRDKLMRTVDAVADERGEILTDAERQRRLEAAVKAHMARLSFLSSKARAARKVGGSREAA